MLKIVPINVDEIYIPAARRSELNQSQLDAITENMLNGQAQKPIKVRTGKGRFVLIEGVHRLEASKALGEAEISAYIVQAPKF